MSWVCMQVTVSTVGLVPQLRHFVEHSPAQLAVSLHATTDEVSNSATACVSLRLQCVCACHIVQKL